MLLETAAAAAFAAEWYKKKSRLETNEEFLFIHLLEICFANKKWRRRLPIFLTSLELLSLL